MPPTTRRVTRLTSSAPESSSSQQPIAVDSAQASCHEAPQASSPVGHRKGYFGCNPKLWSLEDYERHVRSENPSISKRHVTDHFFSALRQIRKCNKGCCKPTCRSIASKLIADHSKPIKNTKKAFGTLRIRKLNAIDKLQVHTISGARDVAVTGKIVNAVKPDQAVDPARSERLETPALADAGDLTDSTDSADINYDSIFPVVSESRRTGVFREAYAAFQPSHKFILPSGESVENVLYKAEGTNLPLLVRNKLLNWVVDLDDPAMQALFTPEDWAALQASFPVLEPVSEELAIYLSKFNKFTTVEDLRAALVSIPAGPDVTEKYDREKHFDLEWAHMAIRHLLGLWEDRTQPLQLSQTENWFGYNVWSVLLDGCLRSIEGLQLDRTETTCAATTLRRNQSRTDPKVRQRMGIRLDGILHTMSSESLELLAIEAGARSHTNVTTSTKWLSDSVKLVRVMRDMLDRLPALSQVVGIIQAGLAMQVSRMCQVKGYVALLRREEVHRVPERIEGGSVLDLLHLLCEIVAVRDVVMKTLRNVKGRGKEQTSLSEEDVVHNLLKRKVEKRGPSGAVPRLPKSTDSQSGN